MKDSSESSDSSSSSSSEDNDTTTLAQREKRHKKKGREKNLSVEVPPLPVLDFDGSEKFYVDKKSESGYSRVVTLHRPACPKYNYIRKSLGDFTRQGKSKKNPLKRYFSKKFQKRLCQSSSIVSGVPVAEAEEEFLEGNKLLNIATTENPKSVSAWIDLVQFQSKTPMRHISKPQLAERKFDILNKALSHNPFNDDLYELYVDIANEVLPSFEVSKIIEKLLQKDPTNYILWRGLILATQGSMARCVVPDVLKLYERGMQQMYRKRRSDETMLSKFCDTF